MKKLLCILLTLQFWTISVHAKQTEPRVLSYSQLFNELTSCKEESYNLKNAIIEFNPNTDARFLEMDSADLVGWDSIKVTCMVVMQDVHFKNSPQEANSDFTAYLPSVGFQKMQFADTVLFIQSEFEIGTIRNCDFMSEVQYSGCQFTNSFHIHNCIFRENLSFGDATFQHNLWVGNTIVGSLDVYNTKVGGILNVYQSTIEIFSMSWNGMDRVILADNTVNKAVEIKYSTVGSLEIHGNHLTDLEKEAADSLKPVVEIGGCSLEKFFWDNNSYEVRNKHASCLLFYQNSISDALVFSNTTLPNHVTFRSINVTGSFDFAQGCVFRNKIYLNNVYFNNRSTIAWKNLKGKICQSDYKGLRQFPLSMDSIEGYGLLQRELGYTEYREALIKSKRTFYNVFREQGLIGNANEVKVEIKDLETKIWHWNYLENKSTVNYFNWKMNAFLKTFSAYGTDPVIAIIYSLNVILLFSVFYLFFHNDWDIGSRNKIVKRLQFMIRYFKVNKGLVELDEESQSELHNESRLLKSENESGRGKIPGSFRKLVSWYISSSQITSPLRKAAMKKLDILSGTYSELPDKRKRKVALYSSVWFIGFILYTLLLKILNALTLSLNAFTTLGFGSIPTKGFSRYIVIIQGFIGWVLMTIFSVTLISQLIQ